MAAALLWAPNAIVKGDTINSNSMIQLFPNESEGVDVPVEFYIQTDKPIYQLGESVNILYRVSNLGSTDVSIEIPGQARDLDIWVRQEGNTLWMALGAMGPDNSLPHSFVSLSLGETLELEWTWNMTDFFDDPVGTGDYDMFGLLGSWRLVSEHDTANVSVPITINPEPVTIVLLSLGGLGILRSKRHN